MNEKQTGFMGTYFDRSSILRLARWSEILAWVVGVVYLLDLVLAAGVFILQYLRGFWAGVGVTDLATNALYVFERPFRGVVYFIALMAISKVLLILMDMEDNTRRAARRD